MINFLFYKCYLQVKGGDTMKKNAYSLLAHASKKVSERNVNSACMWFAFQPVVPESVRKMKKCDK